MKLIAVAAAAIVAVGSVSAPIRSNSATPQPTPTIQLRSLDVELTTAALRTKTDVTTRSRTAAATPQADLSLPPIPEPVRSAILAVTAIALVPLWYVAFPITLPASIAVAAGLVSITLGLTGVAFSPVLGLALGAAGWAIGPLYVAGQALSTLNKIINPAAAAPDPASTGSAAVVQVHRQSRRDTQGVAGSRRTSPTRSKPARIPSAHSAAQKSPNAGSAVKSRGGTGSSGRSTDKH